MRYQQKHEEWTKIREVLKEKFNAPASQKIGDENLESQPSDKYWNHMSRLTGRSREDILNRLKNS